MIPHRHGLTKVIPPPNRIADAAERVLTEYKKGYPGSGTGIDRKALWAAFDNLEAALVAERQARLESDYTR